MFPSFHSFHSAELQIIQFIQEYRNPVFDAFFTFLNLFDTPAFFFVLIPAVWLGKGWKTGLKVSYILFLSGLINHALKGLFLFPRPFHLDPSLGVIQVSGYGFPSGAAQTVMLLSGILLTSVKSPWKWCIALLYILSISFSRLYLGVHFPTDILAGWAVGFALWVFYATAFPAIEKRLAKWKAPTLFLLSQLGPLVPLIVPHTSSAIHICACAMGMGAGLFINHVRNWFLSTSKNKKEGSLRGLIGIGGTFFCYFILSKLPIPQAPPTEFFEFFILGLWVATGSTLLCRQIFPGFEPPIGVRKDA